MVTGQHPRSTADAVVVEVSPFTFVVIMGAAFIVTTWSIWQILQHLLQGLEVSGLRLRNQTRHIPGIIGRYIKNTEKERR